MAAVVADISDFVCLMLPEDGLVIPLKYPPRRSVLWVRVLWVRVLWVRVLWVRVLWVRVLFHLPCDLHIHP
jgi:hypothetical protein